jgi:uncharacterized protein (DUF1778 family)
MAHARVSSELREMRAASPMCGRERKKSLLEKASVTARLEARLPADVYALLKRAAEIEGRTLTDFVVTAAREAASRTIEGTDILRLSVEDQRPTAEAILSPPRPAPALRRAFKRCRELFGSA